MTPDGNKIPAQGNEDTFIKRYTAFAGAFVDATGKFAQAVAEGPSSYLPGLGGAVLVVGIAVKIMPWFTLHPSEFISLVVSSLILIGVGSWFRFHQFRVQQLVSEELREFGIDLLNRTAEVASDITKKSTEDVKL